MGEIFEDKGWTWKQEFYNGSGWQDEPPPDNPRNREHWKLERIGEVECYGGNLHMWVGFDWMGDKKWHLGTGGSPRLSKLYDTPQEAMLDARPIAREMAADALLRAVEELNRRIRVYKAVL